MTRIVEWVCQIPTPYNEHLFRAIAKDANFELRVHYMAPGHQSRPWQSRFGQGYCYRFFRRIGGIDWRLLRLTLHDDGRLFVVGGWHEPTLLILLVLLVSQHRPFVIWTDAPRLRGQGGRVKAFSRQLLLKWLFKHVPAVLGTGRLALNNLERLGCSKDRLENFPYVADIDLYSQASIELRRYRDAAFVSVGRLANRDKGYDLALRALAALKERDLLSGFCYRIAGSGPDADALKELARALGIEQHVEFLGWLSTDATADLMASGAIFLHPAPFEPYGVAVIEAMAAGMIVIGSDQTGAVVDRIVDGVNGFVFRADDAEDFAAAVQRALLARLQWCDVALRARAEAVRWDGAAATALFRDVVSKRFGLLPIVPN